MAKIKTIKEIREIAGKLKAQGKKIVTTVGVFDLFHYGHLIALQEAKMQGDVLIVGVNSDKSVKEYKSEHRPVFSENERMKIIEALQCVDYVVMLDEVRPLSFLEMLKPDVHAQSEEYGEKYEEAGIVKRNGGKIHLIKKKGEHSTTYYINRIRQLPEHEKKKVL